MLKGILACLLASVVASPTFTDNTIQVGMTEKQVEAALGGDPLRACIMIGVNSPAHTVDYYADGISVSYLNGRATRVRTCGDSKGR